jgi:hypothetical protein
MLHDTATTSLRSPPSPQPLEEDLEHQSGDHPSRHDRALVIAQN